MLLNFKHVFSKCFWSRRCKKFSY